VIIPDALQGNQPRFVYSFRTCSLKRPVGTQEGKVPKSEKDKRKHKSKKKSHKKLKGEHKRESPERHLSDSPRISDGKPFSDAEGGKEPDTAAPASEDPNAAEWDSLVGRVAEEPRPRQQVASAKEPDRQKAVVSQAPRLDTQASTGGRNVMVGDGGSGWRRRLQMRQSGQGCTAHLCRCSLWRHGFWLCRALSINLH
jgi:hypothetical protein